MTNAGAYDVTELRKRYDTHRRGVALAVGVALLGAGAVGGPLIQKEAERIRASFVRRVIAEELGAHPEDANLSTKELRMKLSAERLRADDLEDRLMTVAAATVID